MAKSTRQRLIEGAIELVSKGGEDALTLRALGTHCGLSRGAPYRHFDDKDALIRAVAAAGFDEITRRMRRAASTRRQSTLRSAMEAYVAWAMRNPAWYGLTFRNQAASLMSGVEDPELKAAAIGLLELVSELTVEDQACGAIPPADPKTFVGVLWSVLHGAIDLAQSGHTKTDPGRLVADFLQLIRPTRA